MERLKINIILIITVLCSNALFAQEEQYKGAIKTIDIINWTHTDYGYTDHPLIVAELQKRYIDIALDCVEQTKNNKSGERFAWTVESLDPFWKWWQETTPDRRKMMAAAIKRGQIDVNALPFNIHPMLNEKEVKKLLSWIPPEVSKQIRPRIAIQCDVNGFQRSIADKLIDQGVKYVWTCINGRRVTNIPTANWWEMPDGRRIFLWNGDPYWEAYDYFYPRSERWRRNMDEFISLETRWPREGEIFKSDEASVRKAHEYLIKKLDTLEYKGYTYELLPMTFSNQWRFDNDGPYPSIVDFVKKWNELGLKPVLQLSTATASVEAMERIAGASAPVVKGMFGDWWAYGMVAMPRETAVARNARFALQAAQSPVLGNKMSGNQIKRVDEIERDICTYYEHTFAANESGRDIWGRQNQGTMNETFRYAYKAYEYARYLLSQKVRTLMNGKKAGIYVINTQKADFSGWCTVKTKSIIDVKNPQSLIDQQTGRKIKLFLHGDYYSFWADQIKGESMRHYVISTDELPVDNLSTQRPIIVTNESGWPVSIKWESMKQPLFSGEAPNLYVSRILTGGSPNTRTYSDYVSSPEEITRVEETPYSIQYSQKLSNPRLNAAERVLTLYKNEERVNIKIIFDRILHTQSEKEVIYAEFPFPDNKRQVASTNGGMAFTPYTDHIPNTCKSFFIADAWVKFASQDETRVWASKTSPVFELGKHTYFLSGDIKEPENSFLLQSMLYNNAWGVNFPVEYTGKTVCEYDIYWTKENPGIDRVNAVTDTYLVSPIVVVNPDMKEYDSYNNRINSY